MCALFVQNSGEKHSTNCSGFERKTFSTAELLAANCCVCVTPVLTGGRRAFLICTKQFSRTISVDWIFSAQITDAGFLTEKIRGSATPFGLNKVFGPKTEVTRESEDQSSKFENMLV